MRTRIWSGFVIGGLLASALGFAWLSPAQADPTAYESLVSQDGMIAVPLGASETADGVAIIDTRARTMSVYHIDRGSGEIALKSVRNVTWDLQLDEFNGLRPTPREVRSLVEPR